MAELDTRRYWLVTPVQASTWVCRFGLKIGDGRFGGLVIKTTRGGFASLGLKTRRGQFGGLGLKTITVVFGRFEPQNLGVAD
jgi:hypothetical protein